MTIEAIKEFKVKQKRDKHPMAKKYPGSPSIEVGQAYSKFMDDLDEDELTDLANEVLVFEEDAVAPFFDSLQVGDEIGLALLKGYPEFETKGPAGYIFEVTKTYPNADKIRVKNISFRKRPGYENTMQEIDLCFEEISWAFGMGYADVLMRDGKLFGVSEEIERTVKVYAEVDDNGNVVSGSTTEKTEELETDTSGSV